MSQEIESLIALIRSFLTPDLLKPAWRKRIQQQDKFTKGHCYVASETLYHLTGRKLQPKVLRIDEDTTHWWLEDQGNVLDPTGDQFDKPVEYEKGKNAAFLTKEPSKRSQVLMERVLRTISNCPILKKRIKGCLAVKSKKA